MGSLPKVLFALLLLLPGGLIVGPAILIVQRWRARRLPQPSQPTSTPPLIASQH